MTAERLRQGQTMLSAWSSLPHPMVADALARTAVDAVTLDMQHGAHDDQSVMACLPAIVAAGKGAVVRIPVGRNDVASRALDFGADAIIAPMINSVADAKAFAAAVKYPPVGTRSWGPQKAMQLHGEADARTYMTTANDKTFAFAMIETREAFASLDAILDVDGIDGVFVGPSDFSISWSNGTTVDPHLQDMQSAVADIASAAKARQKKAGIFVFDPARTQAMIVLGYDFLAITTDTAFLARGAAASLADAKNGV
jgi:4-hydroxy-2-oxoheptanedioate aldolase